MSALPVEIIEPDPAATSLSNDETVNKEGGDQSAPTKKNAEMIDAKSEDVKETNGSTEVKEAEGSEKVEEKNAGKTEEKTEAVVKDEKSEKQNGHKRGEFKKEYDNNRGPRNYNKGPNHSKYDPTVLESTDDHKQIRAQVEFYFGDANLPTDQYLWELTDGASNKPVSIATICRFGRMKRFQPVETVVEALKQSQFLIVSGDVGEETVKRKIAYDPTASRHGVLGRSVYVKGFGEEVRSSQFDIEAYFAPHGPTNAVRLRRTNEKEFKGSVFVEFADVATAEKFLALEPKPLWKGTDVLEVKSKKEYTDGKALDIKEGRMEPSESYAPFRGGRDGGDRRGDGRGRGRGRGRGGNNNFRGGDRDRGGRGGRGGGERRDRGDRAEKGDRDPDDWKKRREDDRASGFKGEKKNDRRGGKGGRGGNRGGRDDRGPRNDRNNERENGDVKKAESSDKAVKEEKSEKVDAPKATDDSATNEKKRSREDDAGSEQPAKKVDTKPEPTAATS